MEQPGAATPRTDRSAGVALAAILALLAAWGSRFIFATSFLVGRRRVFCLFDDAMITMTYARNLLAGRGLRWSSLGDPVEGYTHPLWLAVMLPANLPEIAPRVRSLVVQAVSLAVLLALVWAVQHLVRARFSNRASWAWLAAAVPTAFYYPLNYWALMGLESALVALLAVIAVDLALAITDGEDRLMALWIVCAAAWLLRLDLALLVVAVQCWVIAGRLAAPWFWRRWARGAVIFLVTASAYTFFRAVYFHDLLPNTYYLKLTGVPLDVRLWRGAASLALFARQHVLLLVGLAAAVIAGRRDRRLWLPAVIVSVYLAYDLWIGGDAWELSEYSVDVRANRFLAPFVPLLFVLVAALAERAWTRGRATTAEPRTIPVWAAACLALILIAVSNGFGFGAHGQARWKQWTLRSEPPNVGKHAGIARRLEGLKRFARPGATVATAWAGIPAFFSDYRMIDILGYNDRQVARLPSAVPLDRAHWHDFVPGHVKWDENRLLKEQRPDAFFQVWGVRRAGGAELLSSNGYRQVKRFWLRADSAFLTPAAAAAMREAPRQLAKAHLDR